MEWQVKATFSLLVTAGEPTRTAHPEETCGTTSARPVEGETNSTAGNSSWFASTEKWMTLAKLAGEALGWIRDLRS
jgi:hypothetical protein